MANPMSLLNQLMMSSNSMGNMGSMNPTINPSQFKQFMPRITNDNLKDMVIQARKQGISEEEIEQGLNFIMGMR